MRHHKSKSTGLYFMDGTPPAVEEALERAFAEELRVRLWYGDTRTGLAYPEEEGVTGFVGRGEKSSGGKRIPVPILMGQRRSPYGVEIDTRQLVGLQVAGRASGRSGSTWVYSHPTLKLPEFTAESRMGGTTAVVKRREPMTGEWVPYAEFHGPRAVRQARRLQEFMIGKRLSK